MPLVHRPDWPLLLLPGTLCDARVFGPLLNALALNSLERAALDHHPARCGRKVLHGGMTGQTSVAALADAILATAPDRFIPVGFSLGAIVALEMAMRAPDRIMGMALIAGTARAVPPADWPMRRAAALTAPQDLVGKQLWPSSVAADRRHDEGLRGTVVAMAKAFPAGTLAAQIEVALSRPDQRARLNTLFMPALVLGGADDAIAPQELQCELAQAMPLATLHLVENSGHFVLLERPDACAAALADWLAALPVSNIRHMEAS